MTDWLLYKRKAARLSVSTDVDKKVSNQVVIFCERFFFSSLRWFECFFLYLLCPLLLSPSFIIIIIFRLYGCSFVFRCTGGKGDCKVM